MSDPKKKELTEEELQQATGGGGAAAGAGFTKKSVAGTEEPEIIVEPLTDLDGGKNTKGTVQ